MGTKVSSSNIQFISTNVNYYGRHNLSGSGTLLVVVVLWLNLTIICYPLYLLEIPVLALAGISLLVFRILNCLYSESFFYGVLLCFGIAGFVIVIQTLKKVLYKG